jgi:hypothetical protein
MKGMVGEINNKFGGEKPKLIVVDTLARSFIVAGVGFREFLAEFEGLMVYPVLYKLYQINTLQNICSTDR